MDEPNPEFYRAETRNAICGFVVEGGYVNIAAPMLMGYVGLPINIAIDRMERSGWRVSKS